MIDMIEARIIAGEIAISLMGKKITVAVLGPRKKGSMRDDHLLGVNPEKFRTSLEGKRVSDAYAKYRHVCIETDGGWGLNIWDVYGKILLIEPGATVPGNPPIALHFEDGSRLIVLPGVWGEMRLVANKDLRAFRQSQDPNLLDTSSDDFTADRLKWLFGLEEFQKNSVKDVITRYDSPCIISMMGALGQEALYRAKIHPKRKVKSLSDEEIGVLQRSMREVTFEAVAAGGRVSERSLFDRPGRFVSTVSKTSEGRPCPKCGASITGLKLGGAGKFFICPGCQVI